MPIDPSQVVWDEGPIDVGAVQWDDAPRKPAQKKQAARASKQNSPNWSDVRTRVSTTGGARDRRFADVQGRDAISQGPIRLSMPTGQEKTVAYKPGMGRIDGVIPYDSAAARAGELESRAQANDMRGRPLPQRLAYGAGSAVARNARGIGQLLGVRTPEDEAQARDLEKYAMQDFGVKTGVFGGNVAMFAAPASKIGQLPTAGRYLGSALFGAGTGYAQPIVNDESRGVNAAVGAAAGVAGQAVGDKLASFGRAAASKISPELKKLYEAAKDRGIQLTPAQLSDSGFVKRLSLMLDRMPFSGATGRAAAQQTAGNRELAKLLGENADQVNSTVAGDAAERIGGEFDRVFETGMKYDRSFLREVAQIKKEAESQMDETAIRTVNNWVERLKSQSKGGQISGRTLQSLDQAARKAATGGGDREQVARAFRESLHEAYGRQAPAEVKAAWDTARRQWATLKTLEPIIAGKTEGGIPLQQLQGAIKATKSGKTARARGNDGELGQLATIGQRMKGPTSSGTAENTQAAALGAGIVTSPLTTLLTLGAGPIGSRVINSGTIADIMMRNNAGQTRQALSPYMRQLLMGAGPTLAPYAQRKERDKNPRKRP